MIVDEVLPKVRMSLIIELDGASMVATAVLDGFGEPLRAVGMAPLTPDRDPGCPSFTPEIAVARALADLHHRLLEMVHERIDRAGSDV